MRGRHEYEQSPPSCQPSYWMKCTVTLGVLAAAGGGWPWMLQAGWLGCWSGVMGTSQAPPTCRGWLLQGERLGAGWS